MTTENLQLIWEKIYFSKGDKTSGTIVSHLDGEEIAEYEIIDDALKIDVYKKYSQVEDFDNIIIDESISNILDEIGLNNETKIKINFLK